MKNIINVNDTLHEVIYVYKNGMPENLSPDQLKAKHNCDAILRGPDGIYVCQTIIDAEVEDL